VDLRQARRALGAVEERARESGVSVCAAVVDGGGNPVATMRMDGAQLGAYELALDKAWTAVAFAAPTEEWAEPTAPGRKAWGFSTVLAGRVVVFAGGVPLMEDGRATGAVGVSGASPDVDGACARAGLGALQGGR
jgi:uncharacterized protein GlcG (DUF336 family)